MTYPDSLEPTTTEVDPGSTATFGETEGRVPLVLVVDDEPHILKAVNRLLMNRDIELRTAADGAEAIEVLSESNVALIISDQRMPGLSGTALLNYAMKHHPKTVRVMLTGNSDYTTAIEAINLGHVFRFVAKPWDRETFLRVIDDALEQHELLVSKRRYEEHINRQNAELKALNEDLEARVNERTSQLEAQREEIAALYDELADSFDSIIRAMLSIMEIGDINIADHCQRTARRVTRFAKEIDLDEELSRQLQRAALLHWIGLINAPRSIFEQDVSAYDAEERATWEFHPILGKQAIAQIPALADAGEIIMTYLRRHDAPATGRGPSIRRAAHMLYICSTFEKIRYLQEGDDDAAIEVAVANIRDRLGDEIDPELGRAFLEMIATESGGVSVEREVSVDALEPGMVLARPVSTAHGVPIAPREVVLTPELIARLRRFEDSKGLGKIFVRSTP